MTDAPTPNTPLSQDDVKLLRRGDWLLVRSYENKMRVCRLLKEPTPDADTLRVDEDGQTHPNVWGMHRFTFLARPADPNDPEGWVKHDGGENPAPGIRVDVKHRCSAPTTGASDDLPWWEHKGEPHDITHWRPHVPARGGEGERDAIDYALMANDWLEWTRFEGGSPETEEIKKAHAKIRAALTASRRLEPLADDPAVAALLDSQYRAGALAGWNAACHPDPGAGEQIMARIRSIDAGKPRADLGAQSPAKGSPAMTNSDICPSPVYTAAYDSIRKGAPGLSDLTCMAIARSINMKVAAHPAPTQPTNAPDGREPSKEQIASWLSEAQKSVVHAVDQAQYVVRKALARSEALAFGTGGEVTQSLKERLLARTQQIELPSKRVFDGPSVNPDGPEAWVEIERLLVGIGKIARSKSVHPSHYRNLAAALLKSQDQADV